MSGKLRYIHKALHRKIRKESGANEYPSTARIDSQSVRTFKMSAIEDRGYDDGNKKVKGRKRHIAVDSLGIPMSIHITKASCNDKKISQRLLQSAHAFNDKQGFTKIYADGGYISEKFEEWCKDKLGAELIISKNLSSKENGFVPVAQRWIVERSFSFIFDYRRLIIDHERHMATSQAMIRLVFIRIMLRRLTA